MRARHININEMVKEQAGENPGFNQAPDSQVSEIIDALLPDLRNKEAHRLLYGYPRNISQIHYLRKLGVYPHKVFLINSDLKRAASRLCEKLYKKDHPTTEAEKHKIEAILHEYHT
jgi:adenylate kinase family enzyme